MLNYLNKNHFKFLLSLILFLLIIFIINNEFVSNFIWWFPELFGDLRTPVRWLECFNSGLDFFKDKTSFMECSKREFNYGKIFFEIPFSENLKYFYTKILPYLLIFFAIFFILKIFNIKNYFSLIIPILVIFNPSSYLLFSGANIDLIIFVLLLFIIYNRVYLINWILYFFLTFVKIYPIILFLNIFFENIKRSNKSILIIILFLFFISSLYLFINFDEYVYFLKNLSGAKAGYHYLFSLNSLAKILRYKFEFNYIFLLILTYSFFIFLVVKIYNQINNDLDKQSYKDNFFYNYKFKLFILTSYISIISFIFFSNFFHREVFLVGVIPLILKFDEDTKIFKFRLIIYMFLLKFIYSYIYSYYNINDNILYVNDQRVFSNLFLTIISIKSLIDYAIMAIISALSIYNTKLFYAYFKNRIKKL